MERLVQKNINTGEEYDSIYFRRQKERIDEFDLRRWKKLLRYYYGGRLLDVGCLDSLIPMMAKNKYPKSEIWGIDIAENAIQAMRKKYPIIQWRVRNLYKTEFASASFDYVILGEVLEHLESPEKALQEMMRILAPKGILALSTPLNESIEPGAVDKERHLWSFSAGDMYHLLSSYGRVKIKKISSRWFPTYKYHFPNLIAYCFKT